MGEGRRSKFLHFEDVYKHYGNRCILNDIDLSVSREEFCTVVGPSGCGKSTLLRLILGQERATSGNIYLEGKPVVLPDTERGIVYQRYTLFPHLSVLDNVLLGKRLSHTFWQRHRLKTILHEQAMYYLERVQLADHSHKYPHELSGGMQQRVAIAQALIMEPKVLLMDEPFGALDPGTREDMQLFLLELWEELNMTIFFVTHDLEEAVFLGTRIIVLSQFYSDERGANRGVYLGAKIVADYELGTKASSTVVKASAEFGRLIQQIRQEGFDPEYLQRVSEFNLHHPDAFTEKENNSQ